MSLNVRWPCESLKRRLRKILLSPYLAKVKWLRIQPPMLSDQACTPRKAGLFAPVLWDVGGGDGSEGLNIYRIHAPAYNSYRFHSFPLLPCLNWRDSSRLVWIRWWSFHQAFDAATPCYADLLTLKGAVKFRTFLCSWHRIRGFRPKCMETSWKWNKSSNRRWSSGNPLDAFHDSARPRYSVENDWTLLFPRLEARNPMFVWSLWLSKGQFFGVIDQKSPERT